MLGSPSVLVNGEDVGCAGGSMAQADANSCRIYRDDCGCVCGGELVAWAVPPWGLSTSGMKAGNTAQREPRRMRPDEAKTRWGIAAT